MVFIVWEPILPTDWQSPTQLLLSRASDLRASQYWDKAHLLSGELKQHLRPGEPDCCEQDGNLWDLVAVYPKGTNLRSSPSFISGPVVRSIRNVQ
jgi:hypothetical protein